MSKKVKVRNLDTGKVYNTATEAANDIFFKCKCGRKYKKTAHCVNIIAAARKGIKSYGYRWKIED